MNAVERLEGFCRLDLGLTGLIPLHAPAIEAGDIAHVTSCLESGWVSTVGSYVDAFERTVAEACDARFGIAAVNGTAALHAALHGIGVAPGDLVLCPALTFIATANAISYCGASPLFIDSDPTTLCVDVEKLKLFLSTQCHGRGGELVHRDTGRRISALVVVHIFGHSAPMNELQAVADSYSLTIVEDAAEALGSTYNDRGCGGLSSVGVISFNGNKIVTTGGGGVIVTNDETLARRLKHLTTTARTGQGGVFDHDEVGFNYRMPNLNAALGCGQMERLADYVDRKRRLAALYSDVFAGCNDVSLFLDRSWDCSNYWLNMLRFKDLNARNMFLADTARLKIDTRPCWRLMPDTAAYAEAICADDLAGARELEACSVNIPSGPAMLPSLRND